MILGPKRARVASLGALRLALVVLALVAHGTAPARAQSCLEPSALDLRPAAVPLTVARSGPGSIALAWEDVGAPSYHVHEGSIGALHAGAYDHAIVADPLLPAATLPSSAGGRYYLISSECSFGGGSTGRDSYGRERPPGGSVLVTIGVSGGADVFGVVVGLAYPPRMFVTESDVDFIGPFAPGAAGNPVSLVSLSPSETVTAAASFQQFDPDPSFDPPPTSNLALVTFLFDYFGGAPSPPDVPIVECDVRDALTDPVPGATCRYVSFTRR